MITALPPFPSPFMFMLMNAFVHLASTSSSTLVVASYPLPQKNFQVNVARINSRLNPTKMQTSSSTNNLKGFDALALYPAPDKDFNLLVSQAEGEFIINISLGTPPRQFSAIMDTGSDLIWTQCKPCNTCYHQPALIFNPNTSSSFSPLPCSNRLCASKTICETNLCIYRTLYGDRSFSEGYLAMDTFVLGNSTSYISIPNIAFGCGYNNGGTGLDIVAGIVGLGRGPLSLVSQLQPKKFSYCLPMLEENKGILSFGSRAGKGFDNDSISQGIPIISNPALPSYYYISLEGISLDDMLLPIMKSTFEIKKDGTGGMIIDTGTTLSYLVQEAYQVLRQELVKLTRLPVVSFPDTDLDLCFQTPAGRNASSSYFPKLKFHFEAGVVLELPKDNYLSEDNSARVVCLAIMPSSTVSLFGSVLQQNFLVLHDLEKEKVSFFPSQCAFG